MTTPQSIRAGDTLRYIRTVSGYPASAGWVLHVRLVPRAPGGTSIVLVASPAGDDHKISATAAATAQWAAGDYTRTEWVERGEDVHTLAADQVAVLPDLRALAGGYDGRSLAQRTLDDCKAAFATFSSTRGTQRRYKIGEREMEFNAAAEIIKQIQFWQAEVNREAGKAGARPATSGRIHTRL